MPGEYRNPRLIYRHTQNQWKSIQRRKTERGTQNSQQAEETAPNHHHDNLARFVPCNLAQCCIFSKPSSHLETVPFTFVVLKCELLMFKSQA